MGVASLKLWTKGQYLLEKEQNQGNIDLRHPGTDTPVSGGEGGGEGSRKGCRNGEVLSWIVAQ